MVAGGMRSRWGRLRAELERVEPLNGSKRLAKFLLRMYTRPESLEEHLRAIGVRLGKDVQLQPFVLDERYARLLTIEDDVTIGKGTTIYLSDGSANTVFEDPNPPPVQFGAVRICKGAVVTRDVIIMAGVTVGAYAIVGAGSLLTRDVPPRAVVAGVPAKVIGSIDEIRKKHEAGEGEAGWSPQRFFVHMPNWRRRRRIGMTPEEQDLYYEENFPKYGF